MNHPVTGFHVGHHHFSGTNEDLIIHHIHIDFTVQGFNTGSGDYAICTQFVGHDMIGQNLGQQILVFGFE